MRCECSLPRRRVFIISGSWVQDARFRTIGRKCAESRRDGSSSRRHSRRRGQRRRHGLRALRGSATGSRGVSRSTSRVRQVYGASAVPPRRGSLRSKFHRRAGLVTPDGMPLVFLARWMGHPNTRRVYGPDLMLAACERSQETQYLSQRLLRRGATRNLRASRRATSAALSANSVVAAMSSPAVRALTAAEDEEISATIRSTQPDIVWVGLGTPKQERWIASHVGRVGNNVLVGVGAAFDFHFRRQEAGASMDAEERAGVALSTDAGAPAPRAALLDRQSALHAAHDSPAARRRKGPRARPSRGTTGGSR